MAKATLLAFCFAVIISAVNYRSVQSTLESNFYSKMENKTVTTEDLIRQVTKAQVFNPDFVSLYLHTKQSGADKSCRLTSDSCNSWSNCGFDSNKVTVVIVHGYEGSSTGPAMQYIKNAYVAKKDVNLILLDYSPVNSPYFVAVSSAKNVGQTAASVFAFLENSCDVDVRSIECVGHSLGSHVCGLLCAALPQKCSRIVALDPAAPIISSYSRDNKLDISDADNLQILHTSSYGLGEKRPYGHIDFYPNGAKNQYGCDRLSIGQIFAGVCDHMKACYLYADTILHPNAFVTNLKCASRKDAISGHCQESALLTHLGDPNNRSDRGIFYINTNPIYQKIYANEIA